MKKLFYILSLLPVLALAQSQDQNYVKTTTYKKPTSEGSVDTNLPANATIQVSYFDGLGRPIQQVAHKQSATGKDIVTPIEYDGFGRQVKEYLPYVPTTAASQEYKANALTDILNFPDYLGQSPFSEKELENSPLNRVMKKAAPGDINSWAKGSGHEIKFDYQTNVANEVKLFVATADGTNYSANGYYAPTLTQTTTYQPNQLYKTITYDENSAATPVEGNGSTVEFKDKEGRVVLKRTYSTVGTETTIEQHDTYYVYDQYGNLTFVIPPKVDTNGTITNDVLNNLCYQYRYDYRNRLVEKKLPGKQWEFIVYDKLDRVIATGPAFSPFSNLTTIGWMVTKYDVFNRPVLTGWMPSTTVTSAGRKTLQDTRNNDTVLQESKSATNTMINGIGFRYTNTAFPNTTTYHVLSVNYYDDYNFANAPTAFTNVLTQPVYYNNSTQKPKGLPTGSWTRAVSTSSSATGSTSYTLYDYKARPIRTYTRNHLNGFTQLDSFLDFTGKALYTVTTHNRSATTATQTIQDNYTYTDQDRQLSHTQSINGVQPPELIAENTYDELGKLISKKVGNTTSNPLQKIDYTYNIRGWLSEINKTGWNNSTNQYPLAISGEPNDLFAFKINYNTVQNETNYTGKALYNGNIAETYWRTSSDNNLRKYGYFYDDLNRLRNAVYQRPSTTVPVTNMYNESMSYDKNGNIKALQRNGDFDAQSGFIQIDNLNYIYKTDVLGNDTNQLAKVDDVSSPSNSTLGFKNGTNTDDDYSYDANGNMTIDKNKGITTAIKYNHLNLPTEIIFAPATPVKKINYLYSATGEKVKKIVTSGTRITTTDYLNGGFQYENTILQFIPHAEGYINYDAGVYKYVFNYKDHLDNVRVSYTKDNTTGLAVIMEQNHYYPFGLKHTNYNTNVLKLRGSNLEPALINPNKYRHRSYEFQDELGLNWYDFGMRGYMPDIGRWGGIDMLAETSRRFSPYAYCLNNPVYFIDVDGMFATPPDWVEHTTSDGKQAITYDADIKTVEQAEAKGYKNVENVFATGSAYSADGEEFIAFAPDGSYTVNNGEKLDVDDNSYTTKGGVHISENKGIMDAVGEYGPAAFQDTGDKLTTAAAGMSLVGLEVPAAFTATVGGVLSTTGAVIQVVNDFAEGEVGFKTVRTIGSEYLSRKLNTPENDFGQTGEIMNDVLINQINNQADKLKFAIDK